MSNQIDITGGARVRGLNGVITGTTGVLSSLPINTANGIPQLDSSGKILVSQLPNSVMEFLGTWNAATNTPTLANGTGNAGDVYLCNVAGTVNFGAGPIAFIVGDYVVYSGSTWERSGGAMGTVTSVAASITGNSVGLTGSPITTAGTLAFAFAGTNLQYINGAGNLTTFPTLITSIGLSMPSAFSVANSPLTANGTIAVTGAGTASQYIRGDGQLATFPTTGGGGSSVYYYLNGSVNASVAGYKQMSNTAVIGTGTDFSLVGNGLVAEFLTDAGNPNRLLIPSGAWNFEMFFSMSSSGGNQKFYLDLLKYDGSTFTLIASTSLNPEEITGGTTTDLYITSMAVPETTLLVTDRLALRVYIVDNSVGRTSTLHTEDGNLCQIITTFSTGVSSLNGLTANTQYFATGTSGTDFNINSLVDTHTFNLPTASSTKRGALSSADWSTFSAKQNALTLTTTGTSGAATLVGATLNIPNYAPDLSAYVTLATTQTISGLKTFTSLLTAADFTNGSLTISGGTIDRTTIGTAIELQFAGNGPIRFFGSTAWPILFSSTNGTATFSNSITAFSFIKSGGTSSQYLMADGSTSTLSNPVTGTGTTNYLPKFTSASTIGNSVIYESGGNIGIGATTLGGKFQVKVATDLNIAFNETGGVARISSFNDAISAANPLIINGDNLRFWTGGSEKMRLDASGNLGLGVTPSAWGLGKAIEIGNIGNAIWGVNATQYNIIQNAYFDSGYKYASSNAASYYQQSGGNHTWYNAPSGTAGNAITFTSAMTLNASGRLLLNTTDDGSNNLQVGGTIVSKLVGATGFTRLSHNEIAAFGLGTTSTLYLNYSGGNVVSNGLGGNFLIGTTTDAGYKLDVNGTGRFSSSVQATEYNAVKNGSSSFSSFFKLTSASGPLFSQNLQLGAGGSLDIYGWSGASWSKNLSLATTGEATFYATGESSFSGSLRVTGAATFSNDVTVNGILNNRGSSDNVTEQYYYRDGTYEFGVQKVSGRGTDLFFTGASNFNIAQRTSYGTVGGNVLFTVQNGGNVGIGTIIPSGKLDVRTNANTSTIYLGTTASSQIADSGPQITFNGYLAGDPSTNYIHAMIRGAARSSTANTNGGVLLFYTADDSLAVTERMRITSSGNVCIGTTSGGGAFNVQYDGNTTNAITTRPINSYSAAAVNFLNISGTSVGYILATAAATAYVTTSDYRLKQDLKQYDGLSLINLIKTYDYEWKIDNSRAYGVLAHELQEVVPYAVYGEKDEIDEEGNAKMQGVDYSKLVPILVKSIQELQERIITLESKLK